FKFKRIRWRWRWTTFRLYCNIEGKPHVMLSGCLPLPPRAPHPPLVAVDATNPNVGHSVAPIVLLGRVIDTVPHLGTATVRARRHIPQLASRAGAHYFGNLGGVLYLNRQLTSR
ncbi:hypothetical protein KI387_040675, partial [Taxus chinensis]